MEKKNKHKTKTFGRISMKWIFIISLILLSITTAFGVGYLIFNSSHTPLLERWEQRRGFVISSSASLIESEQESEYTYLNEFDNVKFLFYKDGKVKVLDDLGTVKGEFSLAGTGYMNYSSYDSSWSWNYKEDIEVLEDKTEVPVYILTGSNEEKFNLNWEWRFYDNRSMKMKAILTNNLGETIENLKIWFVDTLSEGSTVGYNGESFELKKDMEVLFFTEDLDISPQIDTGFIEFNYYDLTNNSEAPLSDFYIGNGELIGRPETYITAIGLTLLTLKNGEYFIFDPEVTAYKSPTVTGSPLDQWTNGIRVKVSDNSRATETTVGESLDTSNYTFSIPAGSTITGIEISVEGYAGLCAG
jgi:hypothetical protein